MAEWKAKRFWTQAEVAQTTDGWQVTLDGRAVRTPLKTALVVPTQALAEAIAAEWDVQEGEIDPLSMPLTRAANATLDKVIPQFGEVADMLAAYGGSDLLCYRADSPEGLVSRQCAAWDPLLIWCRDHYGAQLRTTTGIMPVTQDAPTTKRLTDVVHQFGAWELTALHEFVTLSGSLVIGLAAMNGHESIQKLWDCSRIDERWQADQWGDDDEAAEAAALKRSAFLQAAEFLVLMRQ